MISDRIKELRIKAGKKQYELADYLKISRVAYTNYELNKRQPDTHTIIALAVYYGVSIDYIFGFTDNPSTSRNKPSESSNPEPRTLVIPDILKGAQVAFHRGEFEDLDQDEVDALADIALIMKKNKEQNKKAPE